MMKKKYVPLCLLTAFCALSCQTPARAVPSAAPPGAAIVNSIWALEDTFAQEITHIKLLEGGIAVSLEDENLVNLWRQQGDDLDLLDLDAEPIISIPLSGGSYQEDGGEFYRVTDANINSRHEDLTTSLVLSRLLPPYDEEIPDSAQNEIRINNPNEIWVFVGIRRDGQGRNFSVPGMSLSSLRVPGGSYQIYFVYSDRPEDLYQGDDFSLHNNIIEIRLVQVTDGNYGINKVN
jgi:hypothetical protein